MKKLLVLGGERIEYELERKRVRNINLRVDREGNIFVSAPRFVPQAAVERFISGRAGQLLELRERLRRNAALMSDREDSLVLLGRRMEIVRQKGARTGAAVRDGQIVLTLREPEDSAGAERAVKMLLRRTAESRVRECCRRLYPLFEPLGVPEPELSFRTMKRSWGNCRPGEGRLCFNTALARLPEDCVEYVVCHELCHFIHPDHSPRFHALMDKMMPDWRSRKKALEKYAPLM